MLFVWCELHLLAFQSIVAIASLLRTEVMSSIHVLNQSVFGRYTIEFCRRGCSMVRNRTLDGTKTLWLGNSTKIPRVVSGQRLAVSPCGRLRLFR